MHFMCFGHVCANWTVSTSPPVGFNLDSSWHISSAVTVLLTMALNKKYAGLPDLVGDLSGGIPWKPEEQLLTSSRISRLIFTRPPI